MPHAGFLTVLAQGPIRPRTEPTQFRQTIRARLSGDARLGQNSASAALAEGRDGKNVREISRSIPPLVRFASPLAIRFGLAVNRRQRACSATRWQTPSPGSRRKSKRVADRISLA